MKIKPLLAIMLVPLLITFSGCASKTKIVLPINDISGQTFYEINHEQLTNKIENEESFLLVVTPSGNCSCWNTFKGVISEYANKQPIQVFTIPWAMFFDEAKQPLDKFDITIHDDKETFAGFKEGKITINIPYDSKNKIFNNIDSFATFVESNFVFNKFTYISKTQLDQLYLNTEDKGAIITFLNSDEPLSNYFLSSFLTHYSKNNEMVNHVYLFDVKTLRFNIGPTMSSANKARWQTFKDSYGLANDASDLAYGDGLMPTMFFIKGNNAFSNFNEAIISKIVYQNDVIIKDGDKYLISDSYFNDERITKLEYLNGTTPNPLVGKEIPIDEIEQSNDKYFWKYENASLIHDELLAAFIDCYLKNATYVFSKDK